MVVFFALGLGGALRSTTHCGVGRESDGECCAMVSITWLMRIRGME